MTDDAREPTTAIDDWLGAAGFIDGELDLSDWVDVDRAKSGEREDPWADTEISLPTLTAEQRRFLLGVDDPTGPVLAAELAAADPEIIAIPDDPDDIDPFDPDDDHSADA